MAEEKVDLSSTLTADDVDSYHKDFASNPIYELAQNVVTKVDTLEAALTRESQLRNQHVYSVQIPTEGKPVTAQTSTGRCWLFAALNVMRIPFMKELKLESFEFSQAYLFFWDKFERCNYFLEQIIDTVNEPLDGRLVQYLLSKPQEDGGQWDMICNLVEKYGVCPKDVFPEVKCTSSSLRLRQLLNFKLREYAVKLRNEAAAMGDKLDKDALRKSKKAALNELYRLMVIQFGNPPKEFEWAYRNKDKEYNKIGPISPKAFYDKYVRKHVNVTNMISLVNDPRNKYYTAYTVSRLGNVVGGAREILYINVPVEVMKKVSVDTLKDGEPVWFGCHVGEFFHGDTGVMDVKQFNYKLLFGLDLTMNKAERLEYGESLMTHAMVFTGVDLDNDGNSTKWRVENSWGEKRCTKGYCLMTDDWFSEFNYQVVVDKSRFPKEVLDVIDQTPVVLPPWDPMGSLAK